MADHYVVIYAVTKRDEQTSRRFDTKKLADEFLFEMKHQKNFWAGISVEMTEEEYQNHLKSIGLWEK